MVQSIDAIILAALSPIDRLRALFLWAFGPWLRPWVRSPNVRAITAGLLSVAFAALGTYFFPRGLLAYGPLVLGALHLVADAKYLVVAPRFHQRGFESLAMLLPLLGSMWTGTLLPSLGGLLVVALVGRGPIWRRALVALFGVLFAAGLRFAPAPVTWGFVHAHNWIALGIALYFSRASVPTFVAALAVTAAIFLGAFDGAHGEPGVFDAEYGVSSNPLAASRWVLSFAFLQSVHYGLWLRVIPEHGRLRSGSRSFSSSYRALASSMGRPVLVAFGLIAVAFWLALAAGVDQARPTYLRLAIAHGPLELMALALFWIEGTARPAPIRKLR